MQTTIDKPLITRWAVLTIAIFAGSAWYGGSVAHALGGIGFGRGSVWLILTTGLSWCVFGPLLVAVTRKGMVTCIDACLVTMAAGVAVLAVGGIVNVLPGHGGLPVAAFNWAWVGLSNVVMATVIVRRFTSIGVNWYRTLAVWIFGLDGAGVLMFWLFRHLIERGS